MRLCWTAHAVIFRSRPKLDIKIALLVTVTGTPDTMHVRVMFELLIPGVEHAKEADIGAEMPGVASDFEEGFCTGLQQEMVQEFLVLQGEGPRVHGVW